MKFVYLTLNWGFGVFFFLIGLGVMAQTFLGGLCLVILACFLLPPIKSFIYSKTNKKLPIWAKTISIFILFLIFSLFAEQAQDKEDKELAIKKAQEKIDYFHTNHEQIITSIKTLLLTKEYKAVISESSKYLTMDDNELKEMSSIAKKELLAIKKAEKEAKDKEVRDTKIKEIFAKFKTIKTNDYDKNIEFYKQLSFLDPNNKEYEKKLDFYKNKIISIAKAKKEAKVKKDQEERDRKIKNILIKLKTIKTNNYEKNIELYTQLCILQPNNNNYAKKLKFYNKEYEKKLESDRIRDEKEEENKLLTRMGLKWYYQKAEEKMGRGTIKYAFIYSLNSLNFNFPYQGSQQAKLQLRKHPKYGKDVILSIEKGQFLCGYNNCKVTVRFDNARPMTYNATEPSDHSTTTLFISNYHSFVSRAKKSKKIYIEAEFYQEGFNVIEFNSEDLKF